MNPLYIDIGNTRIKWQCADQSGRIDRVAGDTPFAPWARLKIDAMVVASVGHETWLQGCQYWAEQHDIPFIEATTSSQAAGVRCAYPQPKNLGIDRWLAVIAAFNKYRGSCVADVGTALTLDAVDEEGQHQGGLICPGPTLARDAVVAQAKGVFGSDPVRADGWLAVDTPQAIASGSVLACASLIDRFVQANQCLNKPLPLLVCGGAAKLVTPWLNSAHEVEPNLVLDGLAIWHRNRRQ